MECDVLVVGGATIDIFLTVAPDDSHFQPGTDSNVSFKHGSKIEVENTQFCLGGNACNVAVGIARLGLKSSLCAEVGNDEFSDRIFSTLYKEKVDFRLVQRSSAPTSFAVGLNYQKERTLFIQHIERGHYFKFEEVDPRWIYLTSLGDEWIKPYRAVLALVEEKNIPLAFSPGGHQLKKKEAIIQEVLKKTSILFVNKEEAIQISNEKGSSEIEDLLKAMKSLGPKMVVITDGKNGSYTIDENNTIRRQEIIQTDVIEKTGAGDAYASAFLAARMHNKSVEEAMRWGTKNAAAVIGHVGAEEGLLRKEEIEKR